MSTPIEDKRKKCLTDWYIPKFPAAVRTRFKALCVLNDVPMKTQLVKLIEQWLKEFGKQQQEKREG